MKNKISRWIPTALLFAGIGITTYSINIHNGDLSTIGTAILRIILITALLPAIIYGMNPKNKKILYYAIAPLLLIILLIIINTR